MHRLPADLLMLRFYSQRVCEISPVTWVVIPHDITFIPQFFFARVSSEEAGEATSVEPFLRLPAVSRSSMQFLFMPQSGAHIPGNVADSCGAVHIVALYARCLPLSKA